jgi:antitoxin component of RelBE/YafQ-DinJ toxin-antitoxin module
MKVISFPGIDEALYADFKAVCERESRTLKSVIEDLLAAVVRTDRLPPRMKDG